MMTHEPFQPETFPLTRRRLIEASAGTGKTYNIANLYLRLLLGDGCETRTVDQILVVTFTRAATNELRGRIRDKIEMALQAFRSNTYRTESCKDEFIAGLFERQKGQAAISARLLNNALLRMDEACIFTIHGFAVRAIQVFLFETGALAEVTLTEGENARRDVLLADIWRQLVLTKNEALQRYVAAAAFKDGTALSQYFSKHCDSAVINPAFCIGVPPEPIEQLLPLVDDAVNNVVAMKLAERKQLADRWNSNDIEQLKSALDHSKAKDLIKRITEWLSSTEHQLSMPGKGTQIFDYMVSFRSLSSDNVLAALICDVLQHVESSESIVTTQKLAFRALLLQYIHASLFDIDLATMQLDEVIKLINTILQAGGDKAELLRSVITQTYPVCMVDEFQDTDPAQFSLFNQLYDGVENTGFFMIGDPKQSIYQFRGADIFSYLTVRTQVAEQEQTCHEQHIFNLTTNFRSKQALVDAANSLFAESETSKTFLYPGIDYVNVDSCEAIAGLNKGDYQLINKRLTAQPLVFIGNDAAVNSGDKFNGDTLRWKFAKDTAQRIALLLNDKQGATLQKDHALVQKLCGGDIAVLVRTGREASAIREALLAQSPPIGSVYQSQKDSVFSSSAIASDVYHVLCAMDEPTNKSTLKKMLATLLYRGFSLEFTELDALDADNVSADVLYEQLITEFTEYRKCWEQYGVLTAMNMFLQQRGVLQALARLPDCDRLVTDLRHLGELLQEQYQTCSSREQLIIWYARQLLSASELDEDSQRIRLESDENLVKIVTVHVSKGLEYPVVFLPFFFLPWTADSTKNIPLYHPEPDYHSVVDFAAPASVINAALQKEMLAEDMRLLYVAVTRAVFQCYIGISAATQKRQPLFLHTVWAHLLAMKDANMPDWPMIKQGLQARLGKDNPAVAYHTLFDCAAFLPTNTVEVDAARDELVDAVALPPLPYSNWIITSYTALAHAKKVQGQQRGGADETTFMLEQWDDSIVEQADEQWSGNIRYTLKGSSRTGECLHTFYEELAKDSLMDKDVLLQKCLRQHGLEKPEDINASSLTDEARDKAYAERRNDIMAWLASVMDVPLLDDDAASTLQALFSAQCALPEMDFDFSLGSHAPANIHEDINRVLQSLQVGDIQPPFYTELTGLITGSIDLLFIHNKKVYVLDYKSNTLGKAPRFYDKANMTNAMHESRYDLQYLIYSVAAHRYMQQRLGERYSFDNGEYTFGGVVYLFLRGMGLPEYPGQGVWFHRPEHAHIEALDAAFAGRELSHV